VRDVPGHRALGGEGNVMSRRIVVAIGVLASVLVIVAARALVASASESAAASDFRGGKWGGSEIAIELR